MKRLLFLPLCFVFAAASAQQPTPKLQPDTSKKTLTVEAACGQCQFGLKGKGCTLAVRFNGNAYFVDGTDIDGHGDAHAGDGFCNKVRQAQVQGDVVENRFKASYFSLLPVPAKKTKG